MSAAERGKPVSITRDEFNELAGKPCFYCNEPMERLSLDRINSLRGYERGNVVPCCFLCNSMKSTMTIPEFLRRCRNILKNFRSRR